jgi:hypothetical protein
MPHWEYRKIDLSYAPRRGDLIDLLNDAGKEGWELVALTPNAMAYMKRSVPLPKPQARDRGKARSGP